MNLASAAPNSACGDEACCCSVRQMCVAAKKKPESGANTLSNVPFDIEILWKVKKSVWDPDPNLHKPCEFEWYEAAAWYMSAPQGYSNWKWKEWNATLLDGGDNSKAYGLNLESWKSKQRDKCIGLDGPDDVRRGRAELAGKYNPWKIPDSPSSGLINRIIERTNAVIFVRTKSGCDGEKQCCVLLEVDFAINQVVLRGHGPYCDADPFGATSCGRLPIIREKNGRIDFDRMIDENFLQKQYRKMKWVLQTTGGYIVAKDEVMLARPCS